MVKPSIIIRYAIVFSVAIASLWAYQNKHLFPIYYHCFWYKLDIEADKNLSLADLKRTLSSAKQAGYNCQNKNKLGNFAYRVTISRYQISTSPRGYYIGDCARLPTREIIIAITNSTTRFYVVLTIDDRQPSIYRILDIKGETIG